MAKATQGCSTCSMPLQRRPGPFDGIFQLGQGFLACAVGEDAGAGHASPARSNASRMARLLATKASGSMRVLAGMVKARSTPATVAWTPDSKTATQSARPRVA